ncbi:hypothetical protein H9643_00700 [Ochrobactrum sp. Sa2BUA5]|uniref:Uncharacterized protein n=1 Tax=Ochrobactrum quorumnocens TaxID=271865 RepID=A0A5N1K3Z2_9HYPH|nr:hypothetical protein [[Ochrobactrum] quorumnocens]KAA9370230.1 hypothetical protein F3W84_05025 [[Ochrobactrum] quorumnocens]MBD7989298.1 hypothetical protein [Ochrobactrum gallinarum]
MTHPPLSITKDVKSMSDHYTLPDLSGVLPVRPIKVKKHGFADKWKLLFLAIIFALISVVVIVAWGPGLYADYLIKNDPLIIEDATIFDGNCRTKKMITECKATLSYRYEGENKLKSVDFSFLSLSSGDYETDVVVQKSDPNNATLTLALDEFWNRLSVGVVLVGIMIATCILFIKRFVLISSSISATKTASMLRLSWAKITSRKESMGRIKLGYSPLVTHSKKRTILSSFAKNEVPYLHYDEKSNETFGLVAVRADDRLPVLLDDRFERLDLTPSERASGEQVLTNRLVS